MLPFTRELTLSLPEILLLVLERLFGLPSGEQRLGGGWMKMICQRWIGDRSCVPGWARAAELSAAYALGQASGRRTTTCSRLAGGQGYGLSHRACRVDVIPSQASQIGTGSEEL